MERYTVRMCMSVASASRDSGASPAPGISRYADMLWNRTSYAVHRILHLSFSIFTLLLLAVTTAQASIGTDTLFFDDFNRSNGSVGSSYTVSGTSAISGNKVYGDGVAVLASTTNFSNANYKVEIDAYGSASYNGTYPQGIGDGIALYARRTASNTYYLAHVRADDTGYIVYITLNKVVGGTSTLLGEHSIGYLNGRLDKLGLFVDGSTISVWAAGAQDDLENDNLAVSVPYQQVISVTDTSITGIGTAGFSAGGASQYPPYDSGWIDNFTVTSIP